MKITSGIKFSDKSRGIGSVGSYSADSQRELVQETYVDPSKDIQGYNSSFDLTPDNTDSQRETKDNDFTWKDGLEIANTAFQVVTDPLLTGVKKGIKGMKDLWESQTGLLIIEKAMESHIQNKMGDLLKNEGRNIQDIQFLKLYENARLEKLKLEQELSTDPVENIDEKTNQLKSLDNWLQQNLDEYHKVIVENLELQPLYLNTAKQLKDEHLKLYTKLNTWDRLKRELHLGLFPSDSEIIADLYDPNNLQYNEQAQKEDRAEIISKLDELLKDNYDRAKIKQQGIQENQDNYRNGNWFYRPEIIDPKYREKVDNNQFMFTDPSTWLEAIPQVGTSIGEVSATVGTAGLGALTRMAAKALGKRIPYAGIVLAVGEGALNVANTAYQRQAETNVEIFSNYTQKVMQLAEERKINLPEVLAQCTAELNSKGILTDNMNVQDIIENALVYNVSTDDEGFEQVKRDSFAGLADLEKQNNALGLWDLAEIGIYSYGGHLALNSLKDATAKYAFDAIKRGKTTNKIVTGLEKGAKAIDAQINRGIYNLSSFNPYKAQSTRNALNTLTKYTSKLGFTMLSEATEEGQQFIIQDNYLQDEGNRTQTGINYLTAFAKNFDYGYQAWAGALGFHPNKALNDNNELSQSMKIGGFIGLLLGGGASTINTFHQVYDNILNDVLLRDMAAYDIANKENDVKVDRWYKAAKLGKVSDVINEIQSIKERFNPEGLTDENINEDIKQARYVDFMYSNQNLQSNLEELNITKGSEQHKTFIKNAVKAYNDENYLRNSLQTALTDLSSKIAETYGGEIYQKYVGTLEERLFGDTTTPAIDSEEALSREQLSAFLKQAALIRIESKALSKLSTELKNLDEFAKKANERGYDMNRQDLVQLRKKIDDRRKLLKEDQKTLKKLDVEIPHLENQEQLEQLYVNVNLLRLMHDKAKNRAQAYLMGYVLQSDQDANLDFGFKTWSSLTQQEKDEIIENEKKLARDENREPKSMPKLIYDYNSNLYQDFNTRNGQLSPRLYANRIFNEDLELYTKSNKTYNELPDVVRQETEQQADQTVQEEPDFTPRESNEGSVTPIGGAAAPTPSPVTDTTTTDTTPISTTTEATPSTDIYTEDEKDPVTGEDIQTEFEEGDLTSEDIVEDEEQQEPEQEDFVPEETEGRQRVSSTKQASKRRTIIPTTTTEPEPEETQNDNFDDQLEFNEKDYTTEDAAESHEETIEPENLIPNEILNKVQSGEQEAIKENDEPVILDEEELQQRGVTRKDDGQINASNFTEDKDGNVRYNGKIITSEQIQQENQGEAFLSQGKTPAEALNEAAKNGSRIEGIQTSTTVRNAWKVGKTLFYRPDGTKPMSLPAKLPGVKTIHTGKELGQALGQPNFLSDKTCYFVVGKYGETTFDPNKPDTYGEAAIYLVMLKGDEAYVMSYKNYKDAYENYYHMYGDELSKALKDPDAPISENAKRAAKDLQVLRDEKRRIAEQYLSRVKKVKGKYKLPTTALTHVVPTQINVTNGVFNNQKQNNAPIFTPLNQCKTFNIPSDPSQILKSVRFGYGTGSGVNTETPYIIKDIETGETIHWKGGFSGRLYIVPTVENTPSGRYTAPIMISEKFFRTPGIKTPKDIILRDRRNPKDQYHCFAEYIYDLMVDGDRNGLLPFIINQGERTRLARRLEERLQFLSKKQIGFDPDSNKFYIATRNSNRGDGYYRTEISLEQIENNPDLKKQILFNIMQYYHWNTDKNVMSSPIPEKFRDMAIKLNLDKLVFYPGELEFTLEDLGLSRVDGKLVKDEVAPPAIAWMIRTGKLMTDMGEYAFRDGFVYVENTTVTEQDQSNIAPIAPTETKVEEKPQVAETKQEAQAEPQEETKPQTPTETPQQRAVRVMNSLGKPDNNAPKNTRFLTKEEIAEFCSARGLKPNMSFSVYFYNDEGKALMVPKVAYQKAVGKNSVLDEYYSTIDNEKSGTFVDVESAKQWLASKLGLSNELMMIVEPAMRMTTNGPEVLGVTRLSLDKLGKLFGQIIISKQGREGIQYHEAWHYINLLVHNERERFVLYDEYRKQHKEAAKLSDNEIEELLAEDFRHWALIENNKGLRYRVLKAFRRIKDFVKTMFGVSDNLLNNVYRNINKGRYAEYRLSNSSVQEFQKTYSDKGVYFSIPGVSEDRLKSMPHITNPDVFYNVVDSLMGTVFGNFNIRSEADLDGLTQGMSYLKDIIQGNKDWGLIDDNNQELVQEVLDNFDLFKSAIIDEMSQLNIKAVQEENNGKQETDTGDKDPTENWDAVSYEFSKKMNTSFNAKLFFYSIPKMEYNEQKQLVPVTDSIFNMNMTEPFDVVWNKLLSKLWDVETWDDILRRSREYAKADPFFASFLNYITGDNAPDSNTETQILTTIKSAKNELITAEFQQAVQETKVARQEIEGLSVNTRGQKDTKKVIGNWRLMSSEELGLRKKYPREWGQLFYLSGMVNKSNPNLFYVDETKLEIQKDKISSAANFIKTVSDELKRNKTEFTNEQILKIATDTKQDLVDVLNDLGIGVDMLSIDYLLYGLNKPKIDLPTIGQFDKLYTLFMDTTKLKLNTSLFGNLTKLVEGETERLKLNNPFVAKNDNFIEQLSIAHGKSHPNPTEFSITGPDGKILYPITQNNYMSDRIRWFNNDMSEVNEALKPSYNNHSLLLRAVQSGSKLKLNTFVATFNKDTKSSRDYFGISSVEDYIAKMLFTHENKMTLPTMADKKTWYAIEGVKLFHDLVTDKITRQEVVNGVLKDVTYQDSIRHISDETLDVFVNYLSDELDAITEYYKRIPDVLENPTLAVDNYHGKIKNGKMDPNGNGGYFRYFSSIKVKDQEGNYKYMPLNQIIYNWAKFDYDNGTNNMVTRINQLKNYLLSNKEFTRDAINATLQDKVNQEIKYLVNKKIISYEGGKLSNLLIPTSIIDDYQAMTKKAESAKSKATSRKLVGRASNKVASEDVIYSIIANHVANTIISIEEVEKAFVGDPAFYKWKRNKKDPSIITERSVDKIKRIGSVLSTGDNLRTFWGNGDPKNETKFTVLHVKDNMVKSNQFDLLSKKFLATEVLKYLQNTGKYTQDQLLNLISDENINKTIRTISPKVMKDLRDSVSRQVAAYGENDRGEGNINSTDAAVFIRPALYKKIVQAVGEWSPAVEKAFDIMESDQDWLSDPATYSEALETLIKPLKMVYFGNHYNSLLKLNIPVFDKMAIFPMFKVLAKGDNYHIYQRMNNEELGAIDMLTFENAVKVGGRRKFTPYKDNLNNNFNLEDLNKPSTSTIQNGVAKEGIDTDNTKLATYIQDLRNLRLQMNTDPHEHTDRSLGTQFAKTAMSNLEKTRTYGKNKGKAFTGRLIIDNIYSSINRLADIGASRALNRFFDVDDAGMSLNEQRLSNFLIEQGHSSGLSRDVIASFQIDPTTGRIRVPISAQSNRRFVESRLISTIGKDVIDINTPGGSAIQMPFFGFKDSTNVQKQENVGRAFNDGKELNPINKDGSMDCMLSLNFFRHIVPKKVMEQGYTAARNWLIEKKIVGPDSNLCALGYRIPTQGLSSTASLKVTDVLPATMGDTIIVPNDFTAMTGSDFDIDKLYIALGYYDEDGNYLNCNWDNLESNNEKQLVNGLLDMYRLAISDDSNIDQTKAPLDNLTNKLKDTILKTVMGTSTGEAAPFYELLPSYQAFKKFEYTGGKKGIGPFALASTNHALTQSVNLHMYFNGLEEYDLGNISDIVGQDGERIIDWLSAMINAHADVAKDPYIINLNVNNVTYNMTAFLLRTGKGEDTFYFLSQPILKEFTSQAIEQAGEYGITDTEYNDQILAGVIEKYKSKAKELARLESDPKKKAAMFYIIEKYGTPESTLKQSDALNKDKLIKSLNQYKNFIQNNEDASTLDFNYYIQQLIVAKAYQDLSVPAQRLSTLINVSQVDTKKYGNSLTQILNYSLLINDYISKYDDMFYVTNDSGNILELSALQHYFNDTFLSKKMGYALNIPRLILRSQMITATDQYARVYESLLKNLYDSSKGSLSKDKALQADKLIDNYYRSKIIDMIDALRLNSGELRDMISGKLTVPKSLYNFKKVLQSNKDGRYNQFVDPAGNIVNGLINYLIPRLGNSLDENPVDSILTFNSSSLNSSNYENRLIAYFSDLIDSPDEKVRKFANRLLKYALYTSLDNKGANTFFHLVPVDYKIKIGYADQVYQAIDQMNDVQNQSFITADSEMDIPSLNNYPSVALSLAKNNANDEEIVKTITAPVSNKYNAAGFIRSNDYTYNNQVTWHYKAFTLNTSKARRDFISIKRNFYGKIQTLLYVKAGTVKVFDTRDGKRVGAADQAVYVAVPTFGYGNIKEYYKSLNELSDFPENNIETMSTKEIIDFYSDHNKFRLSSKNIPFNEIDIEFVPSIYLNNNFNSFEEVQSSSYETAIPESKHEETQNAQKEIQAVEQSGLLKKNNIMSKVNSMLSTNVGKTEDFTSDFDLTENDLNEEAADMNKTSVNWCE